VTWQGWALTLGYVATTILLSLLAFAGTPGAPPPTVAQWLVWAVLLAIITYGFLRLVRARTDGDWAWRWGGGEESRRK
jgi:hypothetical protein